MTKEEYVQLHEQILNDQSEKIVKLESRNSYTDLVIMEIKDDMRDLKESMATLNDNFNKFSVKSIKDDNLLKDLINEQDNRITALETTNKTLKWVMGIGFSGATVGIAFLGFLITNILH